jgi:hypothetical protein
VGQILGFLLFARLGAVTLRMERMVARYLAGRVWRVGVRICGERVVRAGVRVWPGGFAWLIGMVGWQSAGCGSQLRAVLETPEMARFLTATPAAGRVLLPICRMLGIEASVLRPGVPVVMPQGVLAVPPVLAEAERVRAPRVKMAVAPWRIPLPRGVLSAARRAGYGKIPK